MRTKSLLAAAALLAVGTAASMAQSNVYSLNIVGYVNKPMPLGLTAAANPLNTTNNVLSTVMPAAPDFSQVLKWNYAVQDFDIATMFFGSWDVDLAVAPGEGFFVNPSSDFTNTFVGEALVGQQTLAFGSGLSMVGSKIPVGGDADALNLTPALSDFDQVLVWNFGVNDYDIYTLFFGSWSPSAPVLGVAESAFINTAASGTWTNTVNP